MNSYLNQTYRNEFIKTVAASGTPERLTSRAVSAINRSGTTREVIVECPGHGFVLGSRVYIGGASEPEFNTGIIRNDFGGYGATIRRIESETEFILLLDGSSSAATGGPLVLYADVWVRQATLLGKNAARTNNTGTVYIGTSPTNDAQAFPITAGAEAFLPAGRESVGPLINLADFWLDVTTNNDGVYVSHS